MTAPELARIVDHVRRTLPADRTTVLDEAVARALAGRIRVLVLGEAKRGKSTLVNALFERKLLPTGALPVTSVATTVIVGTTVDAEVRYLDGRVHPIGVDEVAGLVSERGNPSNIKRVDTVRITAPSPHLPAGTEVVDTPGTGSVHHANTEESARARASVDLAVLVVAADPPVSAAELALATDVMTIAAAAAVVVNKIDLVRGEDVAEIVEFTSTAVAGPLGSDVPVLPLSLRTAAPTELLAWLTERITEHGGRDVVSSTARALRREAFAVLDGLHIEHELLRQTTQDSAASVVALQNILEHARVAETAARDHVYGEAQRARARLDADHDRAAATALASARKELGSELRAHPERPEDAADAIRDRITALAAQRCAAWFDRAAAELDTAMHTAADQALFALTTDLARARRAAAHTLNLQLGQTTEPAPATPPRLPRLDLGREVVWRELVTSMLAGRLPAAVRRKRLHSQLREWAESAVARPFGRARSALQVWLEDNLRTIDRTLNDTWREQLAALETGLREAARHRWEADSALAARRTALSEQMSTLEVAVRDLDTVITETSAAPARHAG